MSGFDYSSTLFQTRLVYVYRIPPRASSTAGYKASDWSDPKTGDLASTAIWKGRMKVVESEREGKCEIRLEDADSGELFALCPYDISGNSVEAVLDSSRYFVLRVESQDPTTGNKKKAYIGMGFEDRSDSFDFNVALQDWVKRQRNAKLAHEAASKGETVSGDLLGGGESGTSIHIPKEGAKDLSLKQGQTFSIKIPGAGGRKIRDSNTSGGGGAFGGLGGGGLLPPPPSRRG
ncbi:adaptin ear-binding coat-associated protein 1 NECAP-1 [Microstroma glucosiphilum]|uniref:Adaptin ear-binding coat-associated protein 1 NECAP-1 n=1 Tax=Pseudomicrostroma glucosiphilum TaxID=1684307 RepID=A0A316U3W2_9BASI|nr:adaptin ear-binding coat-associated protein 1 NECAP-1 [Pseudomicrostroma glucosiphilum]PWN19850.1 adaptin ear-binding coat-associated protein 1 NECAP-1 [Pseudomicrostroma glucosiphilum]